MAGQERQAGPTLAGCRTVEEALAGLRLWGRRCTQARRLLLEALFRDPAHRSAGGLAQEVRASGAGVHVSTVYRSLDEFVRLGLVSRTYAGGGPAAYGLASAGLVSLVCKQCGSVTGGSAEFAGELAGVFMTAYGFAVDPQCLTVAGWCSSCRVTAGPETASAGSSRSGP